MIANSTNHCGCDGHGHCVPYNTSYYEASELNLHKSWTHYEAIQISSVCQCDPGWTGYGDLGVFQHDALLNCATSITIIKVAWGVSIMGWFLIWIKATQFTCKVWRERKDQERQTFLRPIIRITGYSSALYLSTYKTFTSEPDWERAITFSPLLTVQYSFLIFVVMYESIEADMNQLRRFFAGTLQDFGLLSNDDLKRIQRVGIILKLLVVFSALFFSVFGHSSNKVLWSMSYLIGGQQGVITSFVLALYIKPRTFRRLLYLLNNMVKEEKPQVMTKDYQALEASREELKQKLLTIQKKVSMQYRVPKYLMIFGVIIHLPLLLPANWKYGGYTVVLWTLFSVSTGTVIIISFRRVQGRMQTVSSVKKQNSSSVSGFQSTVAPLSTYAKTMTVEAEPNT